MLNGEGGDNKDINEDADASSFKAQMSITWAGRLGTIDPTQGILKIGPSDSKNSLSSVSHIKIRPKWPHFLTDVWYEVAKKNKYGSRSRRVIKLNEYHIVNIKSGNAISKIYLYMEIAKIWLENSTTLIFTLKSGKALTYVSAMAPSIVQQITTRVQVRLALERTVFSNNPFHGSGGGIVDFRFKCLQCNE